MTQPSIETMADRAMELENISTICMDIRFHGSRSHIELHPAKELEEEDGTTRTPYLVILANEEEGDSPRRGESVWAWDMEDAQRIVEEISQKHRDPENPRVLTGSFEKLGETLNAVARIEAQFDRGQESEGYGIEISAI